MSFTNIVPLSSTPRLKTIQSQTWPCAMSLKVIAYKLRVSRKGQGELGEAREGRVALRCRFEDAQGDGIGGQVLRHIGRLAPLERIGEEVQAAVDHLHREGGEGTVQDLGDGVGEVDQDGIEDPGGPELQLDAVLRADPEVGQARSRLTALYASSMRHRW